MALHHDNVATVIRGRGMEKVIKPDVVQGSRRSETGEVTAKARICLLYTSDAADD